LAELLESVREYLHRVVEHLLQELEKPEQLFHLRLVFLLPRDAW
jgi:hypothetical protein